MRQGDCTPCPDYRIQGHARNAHFSSQLCSGLLRASCTSKFVQDNKNRDSAKTRAAKALASPIANALKGFTPQAHPEVDWTGFAIKLGMRLGKHGHFALKLKHANPGHVRTEKKPAHAVACGMQTSIQNRKTATTQHTSRGGSMSELQASRSSWMHTLSTKLPSQQWVCVTST